MNLLQHFSEVRTFVFDMDGVLTDGGLWLSDDGEWVRRMHIRDGYALELAARKGYLIIVISGSTSDPVENRLRRLGLKHIFMGVHDKHALLMRVLSEHAVHPRTVLYMGDDVPDKEAMLTVGLPCCPSDAARDIMEISKYVSPIAGGHGCVRDVVERVLRMHNDWQ